MAKKRASKKIFSSETTFSLTERYSIESGILVIDEAHMTRMQHSFQCHNYTIHSTLLNSTKKYLTAPPTQDASQEQYNLRNEQPLPHNVRAAPPPTETINATTLPQY